MVQDLRMDSPALEHKFKYQARLLDERTARLQPELRSSTVGGGARGEALANAGKVLPRSCLDTSKAQVQLLCEQAKERAGMCNCSSHDSHATVVTYTAEALKGMGWDKLEKDRWHCRLQAREAAYETRYQNLASTCNVTVTGRDRKRVATLAELQALDIMPTIAAAGTKEKKKRKSSCGKEAAGDRVKRARALASGMAGSNTGYKKSNGKL